MIPKLQDPDIAKVCTTLHLAAAALLLVAGLIPAEPNYFLLFAGLLNAAVGLVWLLQLTRLRSRARRGQAPGGS